MSCTEEMLVEATCHVLETAAFMTAERADPRNFGDGIEARLEFDGPLEGSLRVAGPRALARAVAAGLLGCDPEEPSADESAPDALGELLNQVAGVLAGRLLGDDRPCPLRPPQVCPLAGLPGEPAGGVAVHLIVDDELPLFLSAEVRERAGEPRP